MTGRDNSNLSIGRKSAKCQQLSGVSKNTHEYQCAIQLNAQCPETLRIICLVCGDQPVLGPASCGGSSEDQGEPGPV